MYKGLRFAVLSRILDSGGVLKTSNLNGITTLRSYSGKKKGNKKSQGATTHVIPFSDFIEARLSEARRSILVEVNSQKNIEQLFTICEKYGEIEKVFCCEISDQKKAILLEMKENHYNNLFEHITIGEPAGIPEMCSPFVKADFASIVVMQTQYDLSLVVEADMNKNSDPKSLSGPSMLWKIYNSGTINDFDTRLRFLVVSQLQSTLGGLWKNARVVPFGGSVNGFGSRSSDLDMTVFFESPAHKSFISFKRDENLNPVAYRNHCFNIMAGLLKAVLPGCKYVVPIPGARVPIVKFFHTYVGVECDLSVHSVEGILSTELMYYVSHLHDLVKPLAFALKRWAKELDLIKDQPGRNITSFGLLSMIIFFLQQKGTSSVVLPPLGDLEIEGNQKLFAPERCQAVNRILSSQVEKGEAEDLDKVLYEFFDYYSKFNFNGNGICLRTGKIVSNKDRVSLLIVNPLNNLNITKQVTGKEIERIKSFCSKAKKHYDKRKGFSESLFNANLYGGKEFETTNNQKRTKAYNTTTL